MGALRAERVLCFPEAPATLGRRIADALRPAVFSRRPSKPLSPTAYLDGLRGFAAFMVYWMHHQLWAHTGIPDGEALEYGYGHNGRHFFACLPVVRTFFSGGHIAVAVFFVISGYVLSAKPLSLMHTGELLRLDDNLASALFRRWARLYIPCMATTFLFATSWHAFNIPTFWPQHQPNYLAEVRHWYAEFKNWSFLFGESLFFSYNVHLWSIPVEFRGSITVYTTLLALSRATKNARLWLEVGLIFFFLYEVDGWYLSMFLAGMHICDLTLLAENDELPRIYSRLKPYKLYITYIFFTIGIFLSGVPSAGPGLGALQDSPGWHYLLFLKPEVMTDFKWLYLFWAAAFIVASTRHIAWLKFFFETPFCQYLGRISYSLYLVHGPILWTLGERIYLAVGWPGRDNIPDDVVPWKNLYPLPKTGPMFLEVRFLLPHLILLPVTLWTAEITTKLFDEPGIKIPRWLYNKVEEPRT